MTPPALATVWFDPRGRLSRRVYGRRVVGLFGLSEILLCTAAALAAQGWRPAAFGTAAAIAAVWLAGLAQTARRLHDRGRTGWWLALPLVLWALSAVPVEQAVDAHPFAVLAYALSALSAHLWFLLETLGRRGTVGPNRYGPEPAGHDRAGRS